MKGKKKNYIIISYFSAPFSNSDRIENTNLQAFLYLLNSYILSVLARQPEKLPEKSFYNLDEIFLALVPIISSYKYFSSEDFWGLYNILTWDEWPWFFDMIINSGTSSYYKLSPFKTPILSPCCPFSILVNFWHTHRKEPLFCVS